MVSFSDLLSEDTKHNLLKKGHVYKMKLTKEEGVTPKNVGESYRYKYFIIIGFDKVGNAIGSLLINSQINSKLHENLRLYHYPISCSNYSFLDHNSFVDCTQIIKIEREKAITQQCIPFGNMAEEDMNLIIDAVKSSPSVSPFDLKKYNLHEPETV